MKKIIVISLLLIIPSISFAASPTCHQHTSGNYCSYTGKVNRIYINAGNFLLLYFENPVDVSLANSFGMGISNGGAAAFLIDDKPEFAKMFYSTALSAQATGRNVSIQMRGSKSGYLKFDRIWLAAPN